MNLVASLKRRLLRIYLQTRRDPAPPSSIAGGLAVGVFVAMTPIPAHPLVAGGLAWLLRVRKIPAVGAAFLFPLMYPFYAIYPLAGRAVLSLFPSRWRDFEETVPAGAALEIPGVETDPQGPGHLARVGEFLLGMLVVALIAALLAYAASMPMIRAVQARRAARRAARGGFPGRDAADGG